jgi:endonuclease YncB( thermonuclease family)
MRLAHQGFSRSARPGLAVPGIVFVLGVAVGALVIPRWSGPAVSGPAPAAPPAGVALRPGQPADVLHVVDGDTFEARVHVWVGMEITTKVRLRDIDAPELRAQCAQERVQAEAAREGLRALLAEGEVMVMRIGQDKYGGRVLARAATRATPDVSAALLARGLVRPYAGGHRQPWCEGA